MALERLYFSKLSGEYAPPLEVIFKLSASIGHFHLRPLRQIFDPVRLCSLDNSTFHAPFFLAGYVGEH